MYRMARLSASLLCAICLTGLPLNVVSAQLQVERKGAAAEADLYVREQLPGSATASSGSLGLDPWNESLCGAPRCERVWYPEFPEPDQSSPSRHWFWICLSTALIWSLIFRKHLRFRMREANRAARQTFSDYLDDLEDLNDAGTPPGPTFHVTRIKRTVKNWGKVMIGYADVEAYLKGH